MHSTHALAIRRFTILLLVPLVLAIAPPIAAQPPDRPCSPEVAPVDDFQSRGIGLTPQELENLYGEPEIGQGSIIFDYNGARLHKIRCDLVLAFPPGWSDGQTDEFALAESLLPADAEFLGNFARGGPIGYYELSTSLWWSDSLAARFEAMGAGHGGTILILYTYEQQESLQASPIERAELRTLQLPG